jgi:CPA1 family monovalent cation:H+ antiporter
MLSFLLFAGALHIDLGLTVAILATAGVLTSTILVGFGFEALTGLFGFDVGLLWCLVFGALISPTDPVAVLGILRRAGVPKLLEAKIGGESLFNDGIGIVLFSILLTAASSNDPVPIGHAALLFAREAGGGLLLGLAIGGIGFALMKTIDEHNLEILITLAVVMGGYALAQRLEVSGPIAMAVAGLLIGSPGVKYAMSDRTRDNLLNFWSLLDEILNSVLFLTIGLEVVTISIGWPELSIGLLAIPVVLAARAISVGLPAAVIGPVRGLDRGTYPMLVWGGLRGGISIALALTLPSSDMQKLLVTATYVVVVFSVAIQGTTVGLAARRLFRPESAA